MEQETLVYPLADNTVLQDKYTILSVLNAGGFGITYLALDNPGSRYVVIKECMPDAYACRDMETGVVNILTFPSSNISIDCNILAHNFTPSNIPVSYSPICFTPYDGNPQSLD